MNSFLFSLLKPNRVEADILNFMVLQRSLYAFSTHASITALASLKSLYEMPNAKKTRLSTQSFSVKVPILSYNHLNLVFPIFYTISILYRKSLQIIFNIKEDSFVRIIRSLQSLCDKSCNKEVSKYDSSFDKL